METKTVTIILMVLLWTLTSPAPASAYLDPASGSMILQLLLGGVAGLLVVIKLYWRRMKTFVLVLLGRNVKAE
jgi:hypothetical protein